MEKNGIRVFETAARDYDAWFEDRRPVYESETQALKTLAGPHRRGLEIGVGAGRFAAPLGIGVGLEPAAAMAAIARQRGSRVIRGLAEALPFHSHAFDLAAMITVLCFLQDPPAALAEATRLVPAGQLLIGMIDRDSPLGRTYEANREKSKFYRAARFLAVKTVLDWLRELGYGEARLCQTIFQGSGQISRPEPVQEGYGQGGFVVIAARKLDGAASAG